MIKQTKVTENELQKIKDLQDKQAGLMTDLGSIEYQLRFLEQQKNDAFTALAGLEKEITDLTNDLKEKYGDVSIDITTGNLITE